MFAPERLMPSATTPKSDDRTPEELRLPLVEAMLSHVPFDGWGAAARDHAATDIGVSSEMAELAFPRGTPEILEYYLRHTDDLLMDALSDKDLPSMKIRDRITTAVRTRFEVNAPHKEVVRKTLVTLALPQYIALASKSLWKTADCMWRAAGDTSTDHNWYTKRATLSAVYSAVLLYWLSDESENHEETWAFLDRRIADVMKIETAKFKFRQSTENMPSFARFLGRLRYPNQ